MEWLIQTGDGRSLSVEDAGDPSGRPVMVHVALATGRVNEAGALSGGCGVRP